MRSVHFINFERKCSTHGQPLTNAGASFAKTVENLGGNGENPFAIFPEVEEIHPFDQVYPIIFRIVNSLFIYFLHQLFISLLKIILLLKTDTKLLNLKNI